MTSKSKKTFTHVSGKKYDGMMGRCYRETDGSYHNYGGRGIKVCESWATNIESFRTWITAQLNSLNVSEEEFVSSARKFQVDRIDVNGHYTPENCRLVSPQENSRNKRLSNSRQIETAEGSLVWI